MRRALTFNPENCTGCLSCVMNCALANEGLNAVSSARIQIAFHPFEARWPATYCRQCSRAPCAAACPTGAIRRDISRERWTVDYDACNGCLACVEACPFGAMTYDPITQKVLKCETCDGDPVCVRSCPAGALQWREVTDRSPIPKVMISS